MKATGIVRRIDDLGRVVIPKEIRRTMRIREGDPLEIFTAADGEVIFKKYSPMGELPETAAQLTEVLSRATELPVLITDRDHVLAVAGASKRELLERRVSEELEQLMTDRTSYIASPETVSLYPISGFEREAAIALPIIGGGDVSGAVVMLLREDGSMPTSEEKKLMQVAASFLGKQTEESSSAHTEKTACCGAIPHRRFFSAFSRSILFRISVKSVLWSVA